MDEQKVGITEAEEREPTRQNFEIGELVITKEDVIGSLVANMAGDVLMARVRGPKEAFDGWAAAAFDAAEALHAEGVRRGHYPPPQS